MPAWAALALVIAMASSALPSGAAHAQVTGLNPQNASVTVTFAFQTRVNDKAPWTNLPTTVELTTNGVNGTANFDTGWQSLPPQGQGN